MEVNEAFLGFVELSRTDTLTITNSGQGNDGCSKMSGELSGVQKKIQQLGTMRNDDLINYSSNWRCNVNFS